MCNILYIYIYIYRYICIIIYYVSVCAHSCTYRQRISFRLLSTRAMITGTTSPTNSSKAGVHSLALGENGRILRNWGSLGWVSKIKLRLSNFGMENLLENIQQLFFVENAAEKICLGLKKMPTDSFQAWSETDCQIRGGALATSEWYVYYVYIYMLSIMYIWYMYVM